MPQLKQIAHAIDTITLPKSGIKISIRRRATGQDKQEALEATRDGKAYHPRQQYLRYLGYLAASLMTEWDALDVKGKPLPISPQELGAMEDEDDYRFLLEDVAGRVALREADPEKEDPFKKRSSRSSRATSSRTPANSPAS